MAGWIYGCQENYSQHWLALHSLSIQQWLFTARVNKAKLKTINLCRNSAEQISNMMTSVMQDLDRSPVKDD